LGIEGQSIGPEKIVYSKNHVNFFLGKPINGKEATVADGVTIGFLAESSEEVEAFHKAGLEAGGVNDGETGRRDALPMNNCGAYLLDPVGTKICSFWMDA